MRILNVLLAVYWAALFVAFITGNYTPDSFAISTAFFITSLSFVSLALEAK